MDKGPEAALERFVETQVREAVEKPAGASGVIVLKADGKTGRRLRAAAAFLAFFLGMSLIFGNLGAVAGRLAWQRDTEGWWSGDWQETQAFRNTVSDYLETFLTLGAGGSLDWWSGAALAGGAGYDGYERYDGWTGQITEAIIGAVDSAASSSEAYSYGGDARLEELLKTNPDYLYENDKNVLYRIRRDLGNLGYSNAPPDQFISIYDYLPEGYNFLLTYEEGKVRIWKDGAELDVYGDGFYDGDSLWYVPGYENFPAGDGAEGVKVYLAVREVPAQYLQGDYANGGAYSNNQLYWLYQDMRQSQTFFRNAAMTLAAGLALLVLALALRKDRAAANRKIASWTVHVWTEARFLLVAGGLLALPLWTVGNYAGFWHELWYGMLYNGLPFYDLPSLLRGLAGLGESTPALLFLFWTLWLIRNDHRHNPKENRRSLWRRVSVRSRKYPFQKRLTWRNRAALALACVPVLAAAAVLTAARAWDEPLLLTLLGATVLCAAAVALVLGKNAALARDAGRLSDQVEAIRDGDLETPLALPADADLRETAEKLNDIQSGMRAALAEQTRSERMKVELISNVSHDLKTPLTSILSYAELLRQEDLPPAAADYARIIDEKAQRLKSMVQDVFDVSKATADQLPVHLERLDLGKLLRQTLADMADPIEKSALAFKTDLPETPVEIVADGKRLYRVFQNLIQNALQYALEGSRVYLTLTVRAGQAEAAVRNTSRTVLPDGVDFTARFVRGDESRTGTGSGLGLSIASSFTEACGGTFRVETVADLFTAVVAFPLAGEEPAEKEPAGEHAEA